jgi:hypothetical protein
MRFTAPQSTTPSFATIWQPTRAAARSATRGGTVQVTVQALNEIARSAAALQVVEVHLIGPCHLLWGEHLSGAVSATFNGMPAAAFQVNSTQAVMATVPAGAATGPVTITTANGSIATKQDFTVH